MDYTSKRGAKRKIKGGLKMAKENNPGMTDDELSKKYPGSFPNPDVPANATDELKKEIARVRGSSNRKALAEAAKFAEGIRVQLKEEPEVTVSELTPYLTEALEFLATKKPRAGRPVGTKVPRKPLSNVVFDFFKDTERHTKLGEPTPGSVGVIDVFTALNMDPVRVMRAWKEGLQTSAPADRVWVRYDNETKTYFVDGYGVEAPTGWTGYVPVPEAPGAVKTPAA